MVYRLKWMLAGAAIPATTTSLAFIIGVYWGYEEQGFSVPALLDAGWLTIKVAFLVGCGAVTIPALVSGMEVFEPKGAYRLLGGVLFLVLLGVAVFATPA